MFTQRLSKKGFTLIELLVVIAIFSVLSSIVLAQLNEARAKARDAARILNMRQIALTLELYRDKWGAYPIPPNCGGGANPRVWYSNSPFGCGLGSLKTALSEFGGNNIVDDPKASPSNSWPIGGGAFDDVYGIAYISNTSGSTYDLVIKLETNHPLRCANNSAKNTVNVGAGVWDFGGGIHGPGVSFCQGITDKRNYLYQGAFSQ